MSESKPNPTSNPSKPATKPDNVGSNDHVGRQQRRGGKFFPQATKFEGRCEDLKGHIFDCTDSRDADTFCNTKKEVAIYIGSKYDYGADISLAVEELVLPTIDVPADIASNASATVKRIWEKRIDAFVKRETMLEGNIKTLYSLVWGQCTESLRAKLESDKDYVSMSKARDGVMLLKSIKGIVFNFQAHKHPVVSIHEARQRLSRFRQKKLTVAQYFEKFTNLVEQVEHCGGSVGNDPARLEAFMSVDHPGVDFKELQIDEQKLVLAKTKETYLSLAILLQSDYDRYGLLIESLQNDYLQGTDKYPSTTTETYTLLANYTQNPRNRLKIVGTAGDGVAFATVTNMETETDTTLLNAGGYKGKLKNFDKSKITCHRCHEKGHYANECPHNDGNKTDGNNKTDTANLHAQISASEFQDPGHIGFEFVTNGMTDVTLNVNDSSPIPKTWILLDNQSTVDVFHNGDLLKNIRTSDRTMQIHCNAGVTTTN